MSGWRWPKWWNLAVKSQRSRLGRRRRFLRPCRLECLQDRVLLCGDGNLGEALPIGPTDVIVQELSRDDEASLFEFTLTEPGRLTVQTRPAEGSELETRTSLLAAQGRLLIQSDGQTATDRDDLIVQHLLPGTYRLKVEGLLGAGDFALVTRFDPASSPAEPLAVNFDHDYPFGLTPSFHITGDFNSDGHLDIATPNTLTNDVSVLLGLGDGSFQTAINSGIGDAIGPFGIATGDFNGDQLLDVATSNGFSHSVSILLGLGDGTFASQPPIAVGTAPLTLIAADFSGDQIADLAVANARDNDVSLLFGVGDGTFQDAGRFGVGNFPSYLTTGDFDADGRTDLAVANFNSNDISLLRGTENGTFAPAERIATAVNPSTLVANDFNRDGHLDLAGANTGSDDLSVHFGRGDGTFVSEKQGSTGLAPIGLVSADYNGDGLIDLAVSNRHGIGVSIFLARPDGGFEDQVPYRAGLQPWDIRTGDFNEDGHADLITGNARSHDVSVLLGLGDGTFQQDPTAIHQGETNPQGMVARDFNGDSILDLAAVSYSGGDLFVFLGRGDGTFQERMRFGVAATPVELLVEDFNRDGRHDLATINCDAGNFSVLLGRGDGTFEDAVQYGSSLSGEFGVTGDFNRDGQIDVVVSGQFATGIAIALGHGDGTFADRSFFAADEAPADGVAGDFNGDGILDLATTNFFSDPQAGISIHLGHGDGTFAEPAHYAVGESPLGIVIGDFNHDGHLDLVNANFRSDPPSLSLLLGNGDGTFASEVRIAAGLLPDFLLTRDFDGDNHLDLIVSNAGGTDISVLLGRGDGTFAEQVFYPVGDGPTPRRGLEAADFNGDGQLDVAIPQVLSNDVSVLLGSGDGSFTGPLRSPVGLGPVALVAGDFSGDGRLDVASVNPTTSELTVAVGAGNASWRTVQQTTVGLSPIALVQADFNRDGRIDVATANQGSNDVSILLGLGTGALRSEASVSVGDHPVAIVAGDFNADSLVDLATANAGTSDVTILLGRGDGTFQRSLSLAAADLPQSLVAGDFNGDGRIDLASANYRSQDVAVYFGQGNGTFAAPLRISLGTSPVFLLASDLNGDGRLDLATANPLSNDVSVLLANGNGTFASPVRFAAGSGPLSVTSADFNGDGRLDLATANSLSDDMSLLLGRGDGTFAELLSRPVGDYPVALVGADFNDDGRADVAVATQLIPEVALLQGLGDATFAAAGTLPDPRPQAPLAADFNGDGAPDVAVLNTKGQILLRQARPDQPGVFDPPTIVNPDPQFAARDLAVIATSGGTLLAAIDAKSSSLSFYARNSDGTFARTAGPEIPGTLPVAIAAGDIDGDGRADLVIAAAGSNSVLVYLQSAAANAAAGGFLHPPNLTIGVGISPSSLELVDADRDGLLDIVVANQFSGDVSVILGASCVSDLRFRAGTGIYSLVERDEQHVVRSLNSPADVAAGQFDADLLADLVVVNRASNSYSVLLGSGQGGFLNPDRGHTFATGLSPTVVALGQFNGDSFVDLAILNEGSSDLSIYLGNGQGGFAEKLSASAAGRMSAGNLPSGLAVHDVNGDGRQDLLVGNEFGDLLTLLGNGDGTFEPYERADLNVALVVADLNGDGQSDFVFSNQARDRVSVQYSQPGQTFVQARGDGLLAPGAVDSADLNRDGLTDLVVANSGANNVLVYLGAGAGQFAPAQTFFAGTKPAGVTIDDLNSDGLFDLVVANEGSNDVTVLLGRQQAADWTLTSGPRLRAGAGPVSTIVDDANDDGIPDILVSNRLSGDVALLAGVGLGFFDDRNPLTRPVNEPGPLVPMPDGFAALGRDGLSFFPDFLRSPGFTISTGGGTPTAAVTGDFNFDGLGDLVVAHHEGVISLLVGESGGLRLRDPFSHPDVPHPVALAAVPLENAYEIYVVNEGQESAVLLTSFRLALPPANAGLLPPLLSVLLLAGPAIAVAPNLLTTSEPSLVEEGDDESGELVSSSSPTTEGGGDGDDADESKVQDHANLGLHAPRAITSLMIGVEDAIRRSLREMSNRALEESRVDRVFAAIDELLSSWLAPATEPLAETGVQQVWDAVFAPLHESANQVAGALWQVVDRLITGGDVPAGDAEPADAGGAATRATADEKIGKLPADEVWTLDPYLAALALAGILAGEWIGRVSQKVDSENTSLRRARSGHTPRPSS